MGLTGSFDLIVIGCDSAGEKAGAQAAYCGKRVAIIERAPHSGGSCINTGTVPSKTLRESALYFSGLKQRGLYGIDYSLKENLTVHDFMHHNSMMEIVPKSASTALFSLTLAAIALLFAFGAQIASSADSGGAEKSYLGFDRNIYPGDAALPILHKTFAFSSYWLSPPPREKENTWSGKRERLRSQGFGFVVLYRGPDSNDLKTQAVAKSKGVRDGDEAAAAAKAEGFSSGTIVFLDIEEGGRLPDTYHAYLAAWSEAVVRGGLHPGVYCSGIPVKEEAKVSITTAEDIRHHSATRDVAIWAYNDGCPPSPGCTFPHDPPSPAKSGLRYASVWQFAQSPRRKEFASRCARTYFRDGNCYAPGDTGHSWFLDVNTATSPDPSGGAK